MTLLAEAWPAILALVVLGLAVLFMPQRGLLDRWRRSRALRDRSVAEDALKHIYKAEGHGGADVQSLAGVLGISTDLSAELASRLARRGLVEMGDGRLHVTQEGRRYALQVIRAHRLWEHYLAQETGFDEREWHERAEAAEHRLTPQEMDELSALLGHPTHDPHGDPIPTADGDLVPHGGTPLTEVEEGATVRVVHIEDEPTTVYAQLVAAGLQPGMLARVTEASAERVVLSSEEAEHVLAPIVAANVFVIEQPQAEVIPPDWRRLSDLKPGERAEVTAISRSCRGPERRRMLDLGILPGTVIEAEFKSPSGDPTAYLIRGATIALRRSQADRICVRQVEEVDG